MNYRYTPDTEPTDNAGGVGSQQWQDFWDNEALVTERDYSIPPAVPRENQPATYVRLADQPLGAMAMRVYIAE